jgi:hypothetical protein
VKIRRDLLLLNFHVCLNYNVYGKESLISAFLVLWFLKLPLLSVLVSEKMFVYPNAS